MSWTFRVVWPINPPLTAEEAIRLARADMPRVAARDGVELLHRAGRYWVTDARQMPWPNTEAAVIGVRPARPAAHRIADLPARRAA